MIHNRHQFDQRLVDNITEGKGTTGTTDFNAGMDVVPDAGVVGAVDLSDEILNEIFVAYAKFGVVE